MDSFKLDIGKRVRCIESVDSVIATEKIKVGDEGEVVGFLDHDGCVVEVAWDRNVNGHDLHGRCKYGHGWRVRLHFIEPIDLFPTINEKALFEIINR